MGFADLEQMIVTVEFEMPAVIWTELERAAGLRFPDDYKRMFDVYPHLEFDRFLGVFHPGGKVDGVIEGTNRALDPLRVLVQGRQEMRLVSDSGDVEPISPFPIFPEPGGLFPWGGTQNGDLCLWLTSENDPNKWPIIITDHTDYWRYDAGVVEFLVGVMRRTIRCPILPATFPSTMRVDQHDWPVP